MLIVVDQFEELYTLCPDEQTRHAFLDLLLALCTVTEAKIEDRPIAQPNRTTDTDPNP